MNPLDDLRARAVLRSMDELAKARKESSFENAPEILALDVDGTLLKYDGDFTKLGDEVEGMIKELHKLRKAGWKIVIWTCRPNNEKLRSHLKKLKVPYDFINDHPWNGPDFPRKIYATVYYDDKAMLADGKTEGLADRLIRFKPWWKQDTKT